MDPAQRSRCHASDAIGSFTCSPMEIYMQLSVPGPLESHLSASWRNSRCSRLPVRSCASVWPWSAAFRYHSRAAGASPPQRNHCSVGKGELERRKEGCKDPLSLSPNRERRNELSRVLSSTTGVSRLRSMQLRTWGPGVEKHHATSAPKSVKHYRGTSQPEGFRVLEPRFPLCCRSTNLPRYFFGPCKPLKENNHHV